jgi:hypothetical protein
VSFDFELIEPVKACQRLSEIIARELTPPAIIYGVEKRLRRAYEMPWTFSHHVQRCHGN